MDATKLTRRTDLSIRINFPLSFVILYVCRSVCDFLHDMNQVKFTCQKGVSSRREGRVYEGDPRKTNNQTIDEIYEGGGIVNN